MHHELDRLAFRDAPHRLDVLSKLPDVISSATDDPDLFARLCDMLLAGIRRADAVALVTRETCAALGPAAHRRRRLRAEPAADRRGGREAEADRAARLGRGDTTAADDRFTLHGQFDWAFCTPVDERGCRGWGLYVAGRFAGVAAVHAARAVGVERTARRREVRRTGRGHPRLAAAGAECCASGRRCSAGSSRPA